MGLLFDQLLHFPLLLSFFPPRASRAVDRVSLASIFHWISFFPKIKDYFSPNSFFLNLYYCLPEPRIVTQIDYVLPLKTHIVCIFSTLIVTQMSLFELNLLIGNERCRWSSRSLIDSTLCLVQLLWFLGAEKNIANWSFRFFSILSMAMGTPLTQAARQQYWRQIDPGGSHSFFTPLKDLRSPFSAYKSAESDQLPHL